MNSAEMELGSVLQQINMFFMLLL